MKEVLILFLILLSGTAEAYKETLAFQFGAGTLSDGAKESKNAEPRGPVYKMNYGIRGGILQIDTLFRYASLSDEITFQGIKGEIEHRQFTIGLQIGFWVFRWLQLRTGYARHGILEHLDGNFSGAQKSQIDRDYHLRRKAVAGLYGGLEFVFLGFENFQVFASYDYFHFNGLDTQYHEIAGGLRFYFGGRGEDKIFNSVFSALTR